MKLPFCKVLPFSLTTEMRWTPEYLEVLLRQLPYQEIRKEQIRSSGFIPAIDGENLVEPIGRHAVYIRFKHTEKPIPKAYIAKKVQQEIDRIKEEEDREVRRPEKLEITDNVVLELIPHAIPKDTIVCALLTPTHIFLDTGSHARAEDVLSALRAAIGTLPVQVMTTKQEPTTVMTQMMLGSLKDEFFKLGERFKAKATSGKSVVSGTHLHLDQSALQELVDDGRQVVELELLFTRPHVEEGTSLWFVLGKDLNLKGIVWPPELSDIISADVGEECDGATILRASLLILLDELEHLVGELALLLEGELFMGKTERKDHEFTLASSLGNLAESGTGTPNGFELRENEIFLAAINRLASEYHGGGLHVRAHLEPAHEGARNLFTGGASKPKPQPAAEPATDNSDWDDLI